MLGAGLGLPLGIGGRDGVEPQAVGGRDQGGVEDRAGQAVADEADAERAVGAAVPVGSLVSLLMNST